MFETSARRSIHYTSGPVFLQEFLQDMRARRIRRRRQADGRNALKGANVGASRGPVAWVAGVVMSVRARHALEPPCVDGTTPPPCRSPRCERSTPYYSSILDLEASEDRDA